MKTETGLLLTDTKHLEGGAVGETKLGLEAGQDFHFDLLYRVTAESADLQRLADLSVTAHRKQHLQLLYTIHRNMDKIDCYTSSQNLNNPLRICVLNLIVHS